MDIEIKTSLLKKVPKVDIEIKTSLLKKVPIVDIEMKTSLLKKFPSSGLFFGYLFFEQKRNGCKHIYNILKKIILKLSILLIQISK